MKKNNLTFKSIIFTAFTMMITIILSLSSISDATEDANGHYFALYGGGNGRPTGYYTFTSNNKPVIKVIESSSGSTISEKTQDQNTAIFCIKDGIGFGSSGTASIVKYNQYFDLKSGRANIASPYSNNLPQDDSNYNKMMWVLENVINSKNSDQRARLLNEAGISDDDFTTSYAGLIGTYGKDTVIADLVDIVEQMAIWHFTNSGTEFDPGTSIGVYRATTNAGTDRQSIEQTTINSLYTYLINGAETAVSNGYKYNTNLSSSPITLDKSSASSNIDGNYIYIGPYTLNSNSNLPCTLSISVTDGTNSISSAKLVKSDKSTIFVGSKENVGEAFYIKVPTSVSATKVKLNVNVKYNHADSITYWSAPASSINVTQPVAIVKNTVKEYNADDTKILGSYNFKLVKVDSADSTKKLSNAIFSINGTEYTTDSNGEINISNRIVSAGTDTYTIEETQAPAGYNKLLTGSITMTVTKTLSNDSYTATASITSDNNVSLSTSNNTITLTVKNEQSKRNYYNIKLIKVDSENSSTKLSGAKFKINNKEYTTNSNGEITITNIALDTTIADTYTIEETQAPDGYQKLLDGQIKLNVTKKYENSRYSISGASLENSNDNVSVTTSGTDSTGATVTITIKNKKGEFDLALRKFIVTINGEEVETREPEITTSDLQGLANENASTTVKNSKTTTYKRHRKDPLTVKKNDKVVYTIRVYNEGDIDGQVTEITDYLPTGLQLTTNSAINNTYGWKMYDSNGNSTTDASKCSYVKTDFLQDTTLNAFNSNPTDGNYSISSEDVQVECTVTTTEDELTVSLRNVAEITGAKNAYNIADRDSTPKSLTTNDVTNYTPQAGTEGLGVQDDDDYEELVLNPIQRSYKLNLLKVDKDNENTKLAGAKFKITLPDGTTQEAETDSNGAIALNKSISLTSAGTDEITIEETQAPNGYVKLLTDPIKIKVTKVAKNEIFVVSKAELENSNENVTVSASNTSSITATINVTIKNKKGDFDLALRKFIVSINGQNVETREPQITSDDLKALANEDASATVKNSKTTTYKRHRKDPLTVKKGDKVIYTIRVYNEGNIDGQVTEITDYLPTGLQLTTNSTINNTYGWKMYDSNGNSTTDASNCSYVKTDYLKSTTLNAFNSNPTDGNYSISSEDVQVECTVTTTEDELTTTLRNVAEITGATNAYNIADRDSTPKSLTSKDVTNYTPQAGTEGLGVQDDDDYEELVLNPTMRSYKLNLLKVDKDNENTKLAGAKFKITLPDGTTQEAETDSNGAIALNKSISLTSAGTDEITIEETQAPNGYVKLLTDPIKIKVTKVAKNEIFVVSKAELENSNENVTVSASNTSSITATVNVTIKNKKGDFDLALRKFITGLNGNEITNREPQITADDLQALANGDTSKSFDGTTTYKRHTKDPLEVATDDRVIYTIRIYNEGNIDGKATEITDYLPEGLEFISDSEINKKYGWVQDSNNSKIIRTTYLKDTTLKAFDSANKVMTKDGGQIADVQVECKVTAKSASINLKNVAEITKSENDQNIPDRDSTPNNLTDDEKNNYSPNDSTNGKGYEDDDDYENLKLIRFDLALRKFITGVNDEKITNREPVVDTSKFGTIDENGKEITTCTYNHTKEPVRVEHNDIVTYTIRIYNEGNQAGYASIVKDDLPDGIQFLPDNETNKTYGWVMYDSNNNVTNDVSKAVYVTTDYLSKGKEKTEGANLLKAFDKDTMNSPDYRDVKIAFLVTEPNTSDRIIINKAQISEHTDKDGNKPKDIDSTPNEWIDNEDDQDIEKIYVKYFDLSLRKWVTQAIVIEDGQEKIMNTGHKAEDDPESVVKVEINKKRLESTVVKFRYSIRITNEGEIAGYATEISDYIPDGLKFNQADNPQWKEVDGKITTDALKDTLLQPGDTATVDVVLTWINSENNMGVMVNVAEISKDKNDSDTPDIDSTPNNKKDGEDDIDDAPVALTVVPGSANRYIALISSVLVILASGVVFIKKYVI